MSSKAESEKLQSRWTPSMLNEGWQILRSGSPSSGTIIQLVEGSGGVKRHDLRGFPLTARLDDVSLQNIDMSFLVASNNGQFVFTRMTDCIFRNAILQTNLGDEFTKVDFSNSKLDRSGLNGCFTDCLFSEAKLRKCLGTGVVFRNCIFTDADLREARLYECQFDSCHFVGCRFRSGSFADSRFINMELSALQLGNTILDGVRDS